ncbi:toprim domain-containing protein [Methylovulum miyakonense]|uniref:toprim domain-containing protein n=1 Tax=Methylovulum miyakonense TaxID=645578 RepID=UPI0003741A02|nr:toprim domain-containing protein [Methylovulum miyakonense]
MNIQHLEDACRQACEQIGVDYQPVAADGVWHVANLSDDHKGKNDARIKLFPDRQGGIVWNHKSGERQTFFINRMQQGSLSPEERARIEGEKRRREAGLLQRQNKAAKRAKSLWDNASPAPASHPYLVRKHVKPHWLRVATWERLILQENRKPAKLVIENALLVPLYNASGAIRSLQAIFPARSPELDRDKDMLSGGGLAGLFWWLGAKSDTVLIAEGFATAATLHEETGHRVYIAFTANNLLAVGRLLREKLPDAELVFCADNDTKTLGNPGLTKATEAAQAVNGSVAVPPIHGDFNDYAVFLKELGNG